MASWRSTIKVPENSPTSIYTTMLKAVERVAYISKVPKNATWTCFKRGVHYFFLAEWERGKERWY